VIPPSQFQYLGYILINNLIKFSRNVVFILLQEYLKKEERRELVTDWDCEMDQYRLEIFIREKWALNIRHFQF